MVLVEKMGSLLVLEGVFSLHLENEEREARSTALALEEAEPVPDVYFLQMFLPECRGWRNLSRVGPPLPRPHFLVRGLRLHHRLEAMG